MTASKAIIVAAGRGHRLGSSTDEIPKCMVPVGGRPILHRQADALCAAGVSDIVVVRGYLGDRIHAGNHPLRFVENPGWESNNILASLLCAAHEMEGGFFFSYADIVFARTVVGKLAAAAGTAQDARAAAIAAHLVIDRRWQDAYVNRTLHPVSEAELTQVDAAVRRVLRLGKQVVASESAAGEFIGLAYFSAGGAACLKQIWQSSVAAGGLERPFGRAKTLRQAYLSDALNAMASAGGHLAPVFIDGDWREIDTGQDLAAAEKLIGAWG